MKKVILILLIVASISFSQERVKAVYSRNVALTTFWQKIGFPVAGLSWDIYFVPSGTDTAKIVFNLRDTVASAYYNNIKATSTSAFLQVPIENVKIDTVYVKASAVSNVLIRGIAR